MDVRQQRSQAALFAAALRLAATAPVGSLTATALAREAGVHRSTFYELASSPADLVERALRAELDDLRAGLLVDGDPDLDRAVTGVTRGVLEHVRRHAEIYRRGLADDSGVASLHPMLARHFRETSRLLSARARLRVDLEVAGIDGVRVEDTAIHFVCAATVGAIEAWVGSDDLDVDAFLALYLRLLPGWWPHDRGTD
ncbi:TetR/AcrR family transcriptional regulator [Nocardioides plantarum]|uniref:TetR/AcrR family transcriptional regulator n=1 Tax=Nocardioides plantarum TaxID=29299 RepID=A0ABV5KDG9_9ACTN|nr:TetR family transcriptional regulator [Nocardioides plantarum]